MRLWTSLHRACWGGWPASVRTLLEIMNALKWETILDSLGLSQKWVPWILQPVDLFKSSLSNVFSFLCFVLNYIALQHFICSWWRLGKELWKDGKYSWDCFFMVIFCKPYRQNMWYERIFLSQGCQRNQRNHISNFQFPLLLMLLNLSLCIRCFNRVIA